MTETPFLSEGVQQCRSSAVWGSWLKPDLLWLVLEVRVHRGIFWTGAARTAASWSPRHSAAFCWRNWSLSSASSPGSTWVLWGKLGSLSCQFSPDLINYQSKKEKETSQPSNHSQTLPPSTTLCSNSPLAGGDLSPQLFESASPWQQGQDKLMSSKVYKYQGTRGGWVHRWTYTVVMLSHCHRDYISVCKNRCFSFEFHSNRSYCLISLVFFPHELQHIYTYLYRNLDLVHSTSC